jgi:DNA-binding NtrC family response regulator
MQFFTAHDWPGNIRELQNCIEYGVIMCQGGALTPDDLPKHMQGITETRETASEAIDHYPGDLKESVRLFERMRIETILKESGGNKSVAMKNLLP